MKVGVVRESTPGERRVALVPEVVKKLAESGFEIVVQAGAGTQAGFPDVAFSEAGAHLLGTEQEVLGTADLVAKVNGPSDKDVAEAATFRPGQTLIAFLSPSSNLRCVAALAERQVTVFAMELIPRITRAQSMDALSSMSTIAGYKGALLAADSLPKFFPMLMTAAGTLPPAKVLVIGAGVAGLQAIATSRRLGAIVEAFDVRPAVKEQVESLGARFVQMQLKVDDAEDASGYAKEVSADTHVKELELIASRLPKNDVVITTALIPGRPAPVLITREMVKKMPYGSVIVDLAAPNGGNCEATIPGQSVEVDGVKILGPTSLLSDMATDASRMYSKNVAELLLLLAPGGQMKLDLEDQILRETLVTHEGRIYHEPTRLSLEKGGSS
ncbi:MAG TPA: Re/Si-specific NAD(P)(+) transhydrogenase subunit alpha [Fimbriimonadaceae bacterium]|nr:Re/Si-specific NAD(P)(+) transhydrogenase subunit alpha [Fimbriimonadaceae bacterium]